MEETPQTRSPILEIAWTRYAEYDAAAQKRKRKHYTMRRWVAYIGILATIFAILSAVFPDYFPAWDARWQDGIKYILIALPIISSILAAFAGKFYPGTDWLVLRAGAEQVMREIYVFRTIMQNKTDKRRIWLETRLRDIQAQVYTGLNGEMVLESYKGPLPPVHDNGKPRIDLGFNDLSAEEYFNLRLNEQREWHISRVNRMHRERINWQVGILIMGGVGAFLAALGGSFGLWVALATAITTAMIGWQEIQNLDMTVRNYSKALLELTSISNHWKHLESDERNRKKEFHGMVNDTESVLWNQNLEYIKAMQEAYENSKDDDDDIDIEDELTSHPALPIATASEGGGGSG